MARHLIFSNGDHSVALVAFLSFLLRPWQWLPSSLSQQSMIVQPAPPSIGAVLFPFSATWLGQLIPWSNSIPNSLVLSFFPNLFPYPAGAVDGMNPAGAVDGMYPAGAVDGIIPLARFCFRAVQPADPPVVLLQGSLL